MAWPAGTAARARIDRQALAAGDADLPLDEVDAGDELGHRVLDLQARVHLEEVERAAGVDAGTRWCRRWCSRRLGDRRPRRRVIRARSGIVITGDGDSSTTFWCRRWIEHSRSTNGTTVPCVIAEQLHLDVPRPHDPALEVDLGRSPNAVAASDRAARSAPARPLRRARRRACRLPPPPATAFSITG